MRRTLLWMTLLGTSGLLAGACGLSPTDLDLQTNQRTDMAVSGLNVSPSSASINEGDTLDFSLDTVCDSLAAETETVSWDFGTAVDASDQLVGTVSSGSIAGGNCGVTTYDADWTTASDANLRAPSWIYGQDGAYTANATVADTTTSSQFQNIAVTVANVEPVANMVPPSGTIYEGVSLNFDGSATDPGLSDDEIRFVSWWWDDGGAGQEEAFDCTDAAQRANQEICSGTNVSERAETRSHMFTDNGTYRVYLRVCDDSLAAPDPSFSGAYPPGATPPSGCSDVYADVTVQNAAPSVPAISGPTSVNEGASISFTGSYTDDGADTHDIAWDFDDTVPGTNTAFGTGDTIATRPDPDPSTLVPADILTPTTSYCNVDLGASESRTITIKVTDDDDGAGQIQKTITVNDIDPVVTVSPSTTHTLEGSIVVYTANIVSLSHCDMIDTSSYVWDCGGGTNSAVISGCGASDTECQCQYFDGANPSTTYTASLTVSDEDSSTTVTQDVVVDNVAPVVTGPADVEVYEGQNVAFDAGYADPAGASYDSYTVTWDFGDGTTFTSTTLAYGNADAPAHHYVDAGSYSATVTVEDEDGGSTTVAFTVTVTEVDPQINSVVADINPVDEGSTVTVTVDAESSAFDNPGDDALTTYDYNWGDGTSSMNAGTSAPHIYVDNGVYTVTVTVTDEDTSSQGTVDITVDNVLPSNVLSDTSDSGRTYDEGATISFAGSFTDPSMNADASDTRQVDTFDYMWNFGDGTIVTGTLGHNERDVPAVDHIYTDQGDYQVVLSVNDDDDATPVLASTINITIDDVDPVISEVTAPEINEGDDVTITVTAETGAADGTSDPILTTLGYEFDCDKDGTFETVTDGTTGSCHFAQDGSFEVDIRVQDEDSYSQIWTQSIVVNNVAPVIALAAELEPINEASDFTFANSYFVDPGADTWTAWWTFTDPLDGVAKNTGSLAADTGMGGVSDVTYHFADDESGTNPNTVVCAKLHVQDDDVEVVSGCYNVTINNTDPYFVGEEVTTTSPVGEGTAMNFFVYAEDLGATADLLTYTYAWGDGSNDTVLSGQNFASHIFNSAGDFNVTVTVSDDDGGSVQKIVPVTVINIPPEIVDVLQTGPKNENSEVSVTPILKSYTVGELEYRFDWGDGNGFGAWVPSSVGRHVYPNQGTFIVNVEVRDDAPTPGVSASSTTVTIDNVAPVVSISAPAPVNEGEAGSVAVMASDVGPDDALTFQVDWEGNGTYVAVTPVGNAPYVLTSPVVPDDGIFPVRVRVYDDVTYTEVMTTVTVKNVAPVISNVTPTPGLAVDEGTTVSFAVSASDVAGANDPLTYAFDFDGDGAFDVSSDQATGSHLYANNGVFNVRVRVSDDDGGQVEQVLNLTVNNAAPVIDNVAVMPAPANEGDTVTLTVTATDAGDNDALTYAFDFDGDGNFEVQQGSHVASHLFAADGTYPVTVRVSDADGGSVEQSVDVVVNNLAPVINSVVMSPADGNINEGDVVTVQVNASDAGNDALTYEFDWACDGDFEETLGTSIATHVFTETVEAAAYSVCVQVRDADGDVTVYSGTMPVVVTNIVPVIDSVSSTSPVTAGSSVTVTVLAHDDGDDTLSYAFDWDNDGSFDAATASNIGFHTFDASGTYTIGVRVSDGTDSVDSSTGVTVTDSSVSLVASANPPVIMEGDSAAVRVTPTGTGPYLVSWDWNGDGLYDANDGDSVDVAFDASGSAYVEQSHDFGDDGQYRVNVRVVDQGSGNAVAASSASVQVNNEAPVFTASSPAAVATEGTAYGYTFAASDVAADVLTFSFLQAPAGAVIDPSTGVLTWTATYHQAGNNTFEVQVADDDGGVATYAWNVNVSVVDSDSDGMPDTWETETFGDLTTAGADTDSDGDGVNDYDEFLAGTDPNTSDYNAPGAPVALRPVDMYVAELMPTLVVNNAADPDDGDVLTYTFEIFDNADFTGTAVATASDVAEGEGTTSWTPDSNLTDGQKFWWHCRANDGTFDSPYSESAWFVVSVSNNAPATPMLLLPIDGSMVSSLRPSLEVRTVTDPDMDPVTYDFELYDDDSMAANTLVSSTTMHSVEYWTAGLDLDEDATYFWRARATDDQGLSSDWSGLFSFTVNMLPPDNTAPPAPAVVLPVVDSTVTTLRPYFEVTGVEDADGDAVTYAFTIYSDSAMATEVASVTGRTIPTWFLDVDLTDGAEYWWTAQANDGQDDSALSDTGHFSVALPVVVLNTAPGMPSIEAPVQGAEVDSTTPVLTVGNAVDAEGDTLTYYFELADNAGFSGSSVQVSAAIDEDTDSTSWDGLNALEEDTMYFWRIRASDGELFSDWAVGSFTVNAVNAAPSIPTPLNPSDGALLQDAPTYLVAQNATDAEGDVLTYTFEIAADDQGSEILATGSDVVEGDASTRWEIADVVFAPGTTYYWHVRASDADNDSAYSDWASFTLYKAPVIPSNPGGDNSGDAPSGGCGCSSSSNSANAGLILLGLLGLALIRRRR